MCVCVCARVCAGIHLVRAPTWLIHGDLDTVVPPAIALQLLQKYYRYILYIQLCVIVNMCSERADL